MDGKQPEETVREYRTDKAVVRIHGTVDQDELKKAVETFVKKVVFQQKKGGQNKRLEQLPVCEDCQEPIQDETAYYINGCWICQDCMETYRRDVLPE